MNKTPLSCLLLLGCGQAPVDTGGVLAEAKSTACDCPGDVNLDGDVDIDDLLSVLSSWGPCASGTCAADVTGDGAIDVHDLNTVIDNWGICPTSCEPPEELGDAGGIIRGTGGLGIEDAGDINGDGLDDVLVGDHLDSAGGVVAGGAHIFFGPIEGELDITESDVWLVGADAYSYAGTTLASGDFDGDGNGDVAIGAPGHDYATSDGLVYIEYGPLTGDVDLAVADETWLGTGGQHLGSSLDALDADGDGHTDLLMGADHDSSMASESGLVHLVMGSPSGLSATPDATFYGELALDQVGGSAAFAGDLDGDGFEDFVLGAPGTDSCGCGAGTVYIVHGPVSGDVDVGYADGEWYGEGFGEEAGISVASAGDFDGDGLDDVVIGAVDNDATAWRAGAAYVVNGPADSADYLWNADVRILGEAEDNRLGTSVDGLGDRDLNGHSEILVGADAQWDSASIPFEGAAYHIPGPVSGTVGVADVSTRLLGEMSDDRAGSTVSALGDTDGDGASDFAVGAADADAIYLFTEAF